MLQIIESLLNLNRTIVSSDCERCMAALAEALPFTVHRYPSGSDYGTWEIPQEWNVIKAELTDGERVLAGYTTSVDPLPIAGFT